jgi:hypothetical protein
MTVRESATRAGIRLAFAAALVASLASCGPAYAGGGGGTTSGSYTAQCRGDFGASAAAEEFEVLMTSVWEFHQAAEATQNTLLDACVAMGGALEMPAEQLVGVGVEGTREVCGNVRTVLRDEWAAIGADTEYTVQVESSPPRCEARFDAYARCAAECDVEVEPGQLELECRGGEIRGGCTGECTGRCAVAVQAECSGVCEGICEGRCATRGPDGRCQGACDGTCRGSCVTEASASCVGECRGGCSVEWERPYCTGTYEPPEVSADCRAACEASVEATMQCTPGQTDVIVSGGPGAEAEARIARVRAAVQEGLATIQNVNERVRRMQVSGRRIVGSLEDLPETIRTVGIGAAACTAGAISDLQRSLASVSMSVEVSVEVSASFSASAG